MGDWAFPALAVALLAYSVVSARLRSTVVTQAMVFVVLGLVVGREALGLVDAGAANHVVRLLAEATLTLVLFTDAVRINVHRLRREDQVPIRLLCIGLPLTIGLGTLAGLALFPALGLWTAAALSTMLAPTDAALGLPVVTNSRLPSRIRQGLNVESGLNDGICVPLLIIFLTLAEADEESAAIHPVRVIAEQIGYGVLAGVVAGVAGAWVVRTGRRRTWMSGTWRQLSAAATALLAYSTAVALGGSGFIAAFVAGIAFGVVAGEFAEGSTHFSEQSGELLNALTFLLFGAVLLGPALADMTWPIAGYAALSLTVVRMVPVAIAMLGMRMRGVTVAFLGWFGPRGLASIVFVLLFVEESDLQEKSLLLTVVTTVVAASVFAHGLSARPGANRYALWYAAHAEDHHVMSEGVEARHVRSR
jgi:NhaP-type Na+/H+ or K+/H+ antiporter